MNVRALAIVASLALLAPIQLGASIAHAAPSTYVVRPGDTLSGIARRLDVTLDALLGANGMTSRSMIQPGDELIVPNVVVASPAAAGTATYVVRKGDTLIGIARTVGSDVTSVRNLNGFSAASVIHPGQRIRVPASGTPAPAPASPTSGAAATGTSSRDALSTFLAAQVGKPYKFFSAGPDSYDCSGLVVAGYRSIGIALPHQSLALSTVGRAVDPNVEPILAGDLILLTSSTDRTRIGHVGVALSATTWIQAVGTGQAVRIGRIPTANIMAIRRVL